VLLEARVLSPSGEPLDGDVRLSCFRSLIDLHSMSSYHSLPDEALLKPVIRPYKQIDDLLLAMANHDAEALSYTKERL
jgi:hypothetical protein